MRTILILLVVGLVLIGLGEFFFTSGRSADEKTGGILPTALGLLVLFADFILLVVWLVRRWKQSRARP